MDNKNNFIVLILLLFIGFIKGQSIYSSLNQNNNILDVYLSKPFYLFNITNLDYLYYDYNLNGPYELNSCFFKSDYFSLNLTSIKGVHYSFRDYYSNKHYFTFCSDYGSPCSTGAQSCSSSLSATGQSNLETGQIGKFGIDDFALLLTYKTPYTYYCPTGNVHNYYFECNETTEFEYTPRDLSYNGISTSSCKIDVDIKTKHVCPYKNTKRSSINYSLVQPNILRFTLDKSSTTLFSFNNGYSTQVLPIKPIVYSCKNDGDIITVDGLFFIDNMKSHYTFSFNNSYSLPETAILHINSTTVVLNSFGLVDDNFFISLDGVQSDMYPILKPQQQINLETAYFKETENLQIICTNCIGSKLKGLICDSQEIIINSESDMFIDMNRCSFSGDAIYLEAPISPFKRSNTIILPNPIVTIINSQVFNFFGTSVVKMNGYFIPKTYSNQNYIMGTLQFSNGTLINLDYNTNSDSVKNYGTFNIPSGYGNGTLSIFTKSNYTIYSEPFSYLPDSGSWVKSTEQNLNKVELQLSFPHLFFSISSIKYNDKTGTELDYQLIEPNIIIFSLNTYSSLVLSFNNDYHQETLLNGRQYSPIIYNYTLENGVITMDGLFIANSMPNYKFYHGDYLYPISSDLVTYFTTSRLSIKTDSFSTLYIYINENLYTKVPDIEFTSSGDDISFSCSNCLGGYIEIVTDSQRNQDTHFSEIGKIVKQYNRNNFNFTGKYAFKKDLQEIVFKPPLPTNIYGIKSNYQLSSFIGNNITIGGNYLYDVYNNISYTTFEFQLFNGTIYSPEIQLLSNSHQYYEYLLVLPYLYGYGNFNIYTPEIDQSKSLFNSVPFQYPNKPIIYSFSKIINNTLKIKGEGFNGANIAGAFKIDLQKVIETPSSDSDILQCRGILFYDREIECFFNYNSDRYVPNSPITIQLTFPYNPPMEPVYFQTYFETNYDIENGDIGIHWILSKLTISLLIVITIFMQ